MLKNILVIDNDVEMTDLFDELFCETNYKPFVYAETDDIFSLIKLHNPSLILLDYNLNGMNGGDMCALIKANPKTKSLPVIIFSAYPRVIYSLLEYGNDDFIEKPFEIDEFMNVIDKYCLK